VRKVKTNVMIAYKFKIVHGIISISLVSERLIGRADIEQGKRHFAQHIAAEQGNIGKAGLREIKALINVNSKVGICILATKATVNKKVINRIRVMDTMPRAAALNKLFMRRIAQVKI